MRVVEGCGFAQGSEPNPCIASRLKPICALPCSHRRVTALIRIDRSWSPPESGRPKSIHFCSRCGQPSDEPAGRPDLRRRICRRCGMGMMLSCSRDALPGAAAAFVICTYDLSVAAVSQAGQTWDAVVGK